MLQFILHSILQNLSEIALTFAVPFIALQFQRWTGVQIEEKHQRALHSAIQSGVEAATHDGMEAGFEAVKQVAIRHARVSVPDALQRLKPTDDVLDRIAERYIKNAETSRS